MAVVWRLIVALLIAAAACGLVWVAYPRSLEIETDIIGNPIFTGFNVRRYAVEFLLLTVALPGLTLALFFGLEAFARRRQPSDSRREWLPRTEAEPEPDPATLDRPGAGTSAYLRLAAVGALLALAIAIQIEASDSWLLTLLVPVTLGYVIVARGLAVALARARSLNADEVTAAVNAVFAGFSLLVLAVASEASQVKVVAPPSTVDYPFAPLWALLAIGILAGAVVCALVVRSPPAGWRRIERITLLTLVSSAGVYLFIAQMAGQQGPPDLFHDGERLGAANLVGDGAFPWRDILFPHGLFSDVLLPALDRVSLDDSRWGMFAGRAIIEGPLFWVTSFALCAWLFWRNWLFLVAAELMLLTGWFDSINNDRLMLLPLSLLALAALLARPTWPRAFALMAITVGQAITVPEATAYSAAVWAVVVAYEIVHRRSPEAAGHTGHAWARTLRIVVAGLVCGLAFAIFLAANHALDDFLGYYRTFVGGHDLTGGLPVTWDGVAFAAKVVFPVAVILVAWAYAGVRIWTRKWFTRADWVVGAAIIGLIPYYGKFLTRADGGHLHQVAAEALIPALYIVYRIVQVADASALRSGRRWLAWRPATVACVAIAVIAAPASLLTRAETLPLRLTGIAFTPVENERLGYAVEGSFPEGLPEGIQRVIDDYTGEGDTIFDFTNSPLLFDYLLDDRTATRFYHVSMAIPEAAQEELVDELEAERPALIAYSSRYHGLPVWDGISNPVRHYMVSDYLLDHYRPVAEVGDYVLMARDDLPPRPGEPPDAGELYFSGFSCDWGLAPEYLSVDPEAGAESVDVPLADAGEATAIDATGWAGDLEGGLPASEVLLVRDDQIISSAPTGSPRADIAIGSGLPALGGSGFEIKRMLLAGDVTESGPLHFYAVAADGNAASELGSPAAGQPQPEVLEGPGGRRVPVREGAVDGYVDELVADPMRRYRLGLPADAVDYNWLTLSSSTPFGDDRFVVSDAKPGPARSIAFRSIPGRSNSEQVEVGSCPQWHGYGDRDVYLGISDDAPPVDARLTR